MSYCKVNGCRFPYTHVTAFHQCGTCKWFGHGQIECNDDIMRSELKKYIDHFIPIAKQCTVENCCSKTTHTTEGHCCNYCGKRIGHIKQCPNNSGFNGELFTKPGSVGHVNPLENTFAQTIVQGTYTDVYDGMGSGWLVRNNNGNLETLFMHSDSWGQYGEDSSQLPIYFAFTNGYKRVLNLDQVII